MKIDTKRSTSDYLVSQLRRARQVWGRGFLVLLVGAVLSFALEAAADKPALGPVLPGWNKVHSSFPGKGNADRAGSYSPGHGGEMPEKSNKGGAQGKGKDDTPGENVQVVVEERTDGARRLHRIPTCQ